MCRELFLNARNYSVQNKFDAPIRIFCKQHPRSKLEAYVDGHNLTVTITCARCDRPLCRIRAREHDNRRTKNNAA